MHFSNFIFSFFLPPPPPWGQPEETVEIFRWQHGAASGGKDAPERYY
jgi:hypothetical protein